MHNTQGFPLSRKLSIGKLIKPSVEQSLSAGLLAIHDVADCDKGIVMQREKFPDDVKNSISY